MRNKPANMKYTDLCIYIDEHIYERDKDNNPIAMKDLSPNEIETIYDYLYNIIIALSIKKGLMSNKADYPEFAYEASIRIFGRLIKKDQDFTYKSKSNKPVKSVLNYIKSCLGFLAISFREEHYNKVFKPEWDADATEGAKEYVFNDVLYNYKHTISEDTEEVLLDTPNIVNRVLSKTVYKKNSVEFNDLKLSFYISILNSLTLENKFSSLSIEKKENKVIKQLKNKDKYIVLWGDDNLITKPLLQLQTRKILLEIQKEIEDVKRYDTPTEDVIDAILDSALPTYGLNQAEDD